jgi:hypothetical protein
MDTYPQTNTQLVLRTEPELRRLTEDELRNEVRRLNHEILYLREQYTRKKSPQKLGREGKTKQDAKKWNVCNLLIAAVLESGKTPNVANVKDLLDELESFAYKEKSKEIKKAYFQKKGKQIDDDFLKHYLLQIFPEKGTITDWMIKEAVKQYEEYIATEI